jgi:hypothetical protein
LLGALQESMKQALKEGGGTLTVADVGASTTWQQWTEALTAAEAAVAAAGQQTLADKLKGVTEYYRWGHYMGLFLGH